MVSARTKKKFNFFIVSQYLVHPERGMEILSTMADVSPEVVKIVYDHNELPSGADFPRGSKRPNIFPLARVVSLADKLCHKILVTEINPNPRSVFESIADLARINQNDFDKEHWNALNNIVSEISKKSG